MIATPAAPLTLADMPIGYVRQAVERGVGSCGFYLGHPAQSAFKGPSLFDPQVASSAKRLASVPAARRIMALNSAKASSCRVNGARIPRMSFPRIGDQSFAFGFSMESHGITVAAQSVYFRHGTRVGAVTTIGVGSVDPAQLLALARTGLRRLG